MALTPVDILHREFRRSFRGYSDHQVQEFLREVAHDYEEVLQQCAGLQEEVERLRQRVRYYEKIEETMQNALVLAQRSADQARVTAEKRADVIIADAETKRKQILDQAGDERRALERELAALQQLRMRFDGEFEALLRSHLGALERMRLQPGAHASIADVDGMQDEPNAAGEEPAAPAEADIRLPAFARGAEDDSPVSLLRGGEPAEDDVEEEEGGVGRINWGGLSVE